MSYTFKLMLMLITLVTLTLSIGCGREESIYAFCKDVNGGGASAAVAGEKCK